MSAEPAYDLGEVPYKDEHNNEDKGQESDRRPTSSFFSDEKGNLKFVNFVVRYPCLVFVFMVVLCIGSAMALIQLARATGNPFTEDENAYDIFDVRSIAYDSLRLAKESVADSYDEATLSARRVEEDKIQSEVGDITYWIYEAKTDDGLFTEEALPILRSTEATILENEEYPNYCKLDYTEPDGGGEEVSECMKPLSVLNIYYASSWDATLAEEIMADLTEEKIQLYNTLSACVEFDVLCNLLPPALLTDDNIEWVNSTSMKIDSMTDHWDGKGDLNEDIKQVTLFMAYMKQLLTKAREVNFFFDSNFNVTNPVAMYSRSILYWGELLEGTEDEDESRSKLKK